MVLHDCTRFKLKDIQGNLQFSTFSIKQNIFENQTKLEQNLLNFIQQNYL